MNLKEWESKVRGVILNGRDAAEVNELLICAGIPAEVVDLVHTLPGRVPLRYFSQIAETLGCQYEMIEILAEIKLGFEDEPS